MRFVEERTCNRMDHERICRWNTTPTQNIMSSAIAVEESHARSRGSVKRENARASSGHSFPNALNDRRPRTQSLRITPIAFHVIAAMTSNAIKDACVASPSTCAPQEAGLRERARVPPRPPRRPPGPLFEPRLGRSIRGPQVQIQVNLCCKLVCGHHGQAVLSSGRQGLLGHATEQGWGGDTREKKASPRAIFQLRRAFIP